eukprot:5983323-Amphidinium_carterae.7
MELEPEMGIFLWNMILGGMPMEGLVWTTLIGRELLQDVMHPDALGYYQHPEGRPHALMFPLVYLLQQFLMTEGTSEEIWRPQYKDGDGPDGELNDSKLSQLCLYVGVTSFRFMEFMEAFTTQMKKMLGALREEIFSRHGLNTKNSSLKRFRAPNHPMWGTCLTVSLVRAGIQRIFVRLPMDTMYTNPVSGCRATLSDSSLVYGPGVLVAHTQTQNQDGSVEITSATAMPEELLLEHDWSIRYEWRVEEARSIYECLAQHTESVVFMRASALVPTAKPEIINLRKAAIAVDHDRKQSECDARTVARTVNMELHHQGRSDGEVLDTTKEEQEHYFCPALTGNCINFASHEYRVVYLTYKGVFKNKRGNWQWDSNESKYGGEVESKGFFFYWYGLVRMDQTTGKIVEPEFLKNALDEKRMTFASTAPYLLGTLKNDSTRQRNQQDAEAWKSLKNRSGKRRSGIRKGKGRRLQRRSQIWLLRLPQLSRRRMMTPGRAYLLDRGQSILPVIPTMRMGLGTHKTATEGPLGARKIRDYRPTYMPSDRARYAAATTHWNQ